MLADNPFWGDVGLVNGQLEERLEHAEKLLLRAALLLLFVFGLLKVVIPEAKECWHHCFGDDDEAVRRVERGRSSESN